MKNYYTYEPFGEVFPGENVYHVWNQFLFTGQYYDVETGQYHLRARQYDPHIYRFTSRDPIAGKFEEPLTLHKYLYCINDPLNRWDPAGLDAYYVTASTMLSMGFSVIGQSGIVWDDEGNWGIIGIDSYGGGLPAAAYGFNIGFTSADTILNLKGPGWAAGADYFGGVGAEYIWGEEYQGIEVSIGAGVSFPSAEFHLHRTRTYVIPVHSETLTFEQIVGRKAGDAFYQSTYYGEARFILSFMAMTDLDFDVLN